VGAQILGCLARLFTTAQEVDDGLVLAGFFMALALNVVLGVQIWTYYGKDGREATSGIPFGEKKIKLHLLLLHNSGKDLRRSS